MREMTIYVADDGSRWDTPGLCEARERENAETAPLLAMLGEERRLDEREYVQHDPATVRAVAIACCTLAGARYGRGDIGELIAKVEAGETWGDRSILARIACDSGGDINRLFGRLACIDRRGREWQQPYYAHNTPNEPVCVRGGKE